MPDADLPSVTLERRPHRDAVVRLREAYRRLVRIAPPPSPLGGLVPRAPERPRIVSEVRK
jgi:hypothetical protein